MGLAIRFGEVRGVDGATWYVFCDHLPRNPVFITGFQRKVDAEIAMKVMPQTGIDWDLPEPELREQWDAYGGREAVKKFVCEHLQW